MKNNVRVMELQKASETEDLLLEDDEMGSLQSSMSLCLKSRISSSRRFE